eukprot:TRINITY_DN7903_c0_g1_i7.p1 TRINITY_DN7903_c0_g1~~TRINITY_DN7903_c0_g1_i7.p1  ORF type:complete len:126 (+),score=13.74 TRINITY_DN7903_c0_g1_i7:107-484(+)
MGLMKVKLRTEGDKRHVKRKRDIYWEVVSDTGEEYVYKTRCGYLEYTLKGFKIRLGHINSNNKGTMPEKIESAISEVYQKYYFMKAISCFNPHVVKPSFFDYTIEMQDMRTLAVMKMECYLNMPM